MPGRGPAPKSSSRRARTNRDPIGTTVLEFRPANAPDLPQSVDWHPRTVEWWGMWQRSAQADLFTESDWSFLLDTALMHHLMWAEGEVKHAPEIRLRVAKYGATPEDRARLRMVFADADEKDEKRAAKAPTAREMYRGLRAVASD